MPSANRMTTATTVDADEIEGRYAPLGDYTVSFETFKQDADPTPYFVGLPGDRCQCAHWGVVTEGQLTFRWPDHEETYVAGDGARRDEDGYFWLLGRIDDVMNVAGHRRSTFEIESALVDDDRVAEAAVVSKPHDIKGEGIVAFVTLKSGIEGDQAVLDSLRDHVATVIGPIAKPDEIIFTPDLPKTRSGKIMRRLLRDVARGNTLGDVTTLANA